MIVTANPEHARTIRMLRDCGQEHKYYPVLKGYNYRLESMQAAILRVKLRRLEVWTEARRVNAAQYDRLLRNGVVVAPYILPHVRHVYHLYTIRTPGRDELRKHLEARNIHTDVHYPAPVHLLPAYIAARYPQGALPVAESAAREVLSLPVHPFITTGQVERIAQGIRT